jgi:hypothetical protein
MAELVGGDQIALGTKQYLLIAVVDTSGVVTDLGGSSPKYTVQDDANNYGYNDQAGTATGMILYCLIDTTVDPAGAFTWTANAHYRLWGRFTSSPEIPYLGPFDFYVV